MSSLGDQAWLEERKAQFAADTERSKAIYARVQAEIEGEIDLNAEFHKAILELAKGSVERARASAQTVQQAAAAILTIYTGLLAVSFSVTERPLPSRGAIPGIFVGLAIVLSSVYLAYLTRSNDSPGPEPKSSTRASEMSRTVAFINWTATAVATKAYWLRAGVVALGVSLVFLPAAFLGQIPGVCRIDHRVCVEAPASSSSSSGGAVKWPAYPQGGAKDNALRLVLYKAQVSQAILDARSAAADPGTAVAAASSRNANRTWWVAAVLGLGLVFIIPFWPGDTARNGGGNGLPGLPTARTTGSEPAASP